MKTRLRRLLVVLLVRLLHDEGDIVMVDGHGRAWVPLEPRRWGVGRG